jgi:hypothetical protein
MKRSLLAAVALALPTAAHSQGSAQAPVEINIQTNATLTRTGVTSFGNVGNSGRTVTINSKSPATDQSTAMFVASGDAGTNIMVSFDATLDLCHETLGCAQKFVFTPRVVAFNSQSQTAAADFNNGSVVALSTSGKYYFWLGGSVTVLSGAPTGLYSAMLTMSVVYQ